MNKRKVLRAFRKLRRLVANNEQHFLGICFNMQALCGVGYPELEVVFEGWPDHSGVSEWPITRPRDVAAGRTYRWEGDQLTARLSLIDYCIKKLEG